MKPHCRAGTVFFFLWIVLLVTGFQWPNRLSRVDRDLRSSDRSKRRQAIALLGEYPADQVQEAILKALDDDDPETRLEAAKAAQRVGLRAAVPVLRGWLKQPEPEARAAAALALGRIGETSIGEALIPLLDDGQPQVREAAIEAITYLGTPEAVSALRERLNKSDTHERILLARALARLRDRQALDALIRASSDHSAEVRVAVIEGLGQFEEQAAAGVIIKGLDDPSEAVRLAAAAALGRQRFPGAAAALGKRLESADPGLGEAIVAALGWFREPRARKQLAGRLQNPVLRQAASAALVAQAERAAIEASGDDIAAIRVAVTEAVEGSRDQAARDGARAVLELLDGLMPPGGERAADSSERRRINSVSHAPPTISEETVETLIAQVQTAQGEQRRSILGQLGEGLGALQRTHRLSAAIANRARAALARWVQAEDGTVAAGAIAALAAWGDPHAAPIVAPLIDQAPNARAIATAYALGRLNTADVRTLLRLRLRREPLVAMAAATALGEVGDSRDVLRLVRAAESSHWPMPAAAAYAVVRLARRGEIKKAETRRALCRLSRSKDPFLRANVAVTMARMGAGECADGPNPIEWLSLRHTPMVRAAAARWAYAAAASGALAFDRVRQTLLDCHMRDPEPLVAGACLFPQMPGDDQPVDLSARTPDGKTPSAFQLVALRLADGSVFIGYTDLNGQIPIHWAPPGARLLEDPAVTPLEP